MEKTAPDLLAGAHETKLSLDTKYSIAVSFPRIKFLELKFSAATFITGNNRGVCARMSILSAYIALMCHKSIWALKFSRVHAADFWPSTLLNISSNLIHTLSV